jgi:biopolymer transport protein TolR
MSSPRGGGRNSISDINVTPFIDVMLVLLIIFMVTAPMMQQGVQVNLPKADSRAMTQQEESVIVTVDRKGHVFVNKDEVAPSSLRSTLSGMYAGREKKEIFLKADAGVPYGEVVRTMAEIKAAGIEKLGMVTDTEGKKL